MKSFSLKCGCAFLALETEQTPQCTDKDPDSQQIITGQLSAQQEVVMSRTDILEPETAGEKTFSPQGPFSSRFLSRVLSDSVTGPDFLL